MFPAPLLVGIALQVYPSPTKKHTPTVKTFHTSKSAPFRPPHFADSKSKNITYAMLRAEAHLKPTQIHILGEGENVTIDWDAGKIRQDSGAGSWAFVNGTLTVECKKGFYRGAANRADALDYLVALMGGLDPYARELLFHQRPFSDFLSADETARIVGNEKLNGDSTYILSFSGKVIKGSLNIRKSDSLVVAAEATSLSPNGSDVYRAQRTYNYRPLPGDQVFRLKLKHGAKVKALPRSAIKLGKRLSR